MTLIFQLFILIMIISSLVIISFFIYFGIRYYQTRQSKVQIKQYINRTDDLWFDYLVNQSSFNNEQLWNNSNEFKAIEEILFSYTNNFSDECIHNQISQFANSLLTEKYRKQLKSRDKNVRINTLYRVHLFNISALSEDIQEMMRKPKSDTEHFQLLLIYAKILPENFYDEFEKVQLNLSEFQFKILFAIIPKEIHMKVLDSFESLSVEGQYAFIDVLGKSLDYADAEYLLKLLDSHEIEIRIRSLKALSEGGIILDEEKVLPFIDSEVWEERLMVAKIFSKVEAEELVYKKLIEDSNWWVRNEVAQGLSLTRNGRVILEEIMRNSKDQYAVDASRKYLLKGEVIS